MMVNKLIDIFRVENISDDKSLNYICQALEHHNQKGFDYLELKLALREMEKLNIKGDVAIQSAFASARAMGIDKKTILDSITMYRQILEKEWADFDKALKVAMGRKVESKQKEIEKLEEEVIQIDEQIKKLKQLKEEFLTRIATNNREIEQSSGELKQAETSYRNTYNQVVETMETDRSLFDKVL